MHPLSITRFFQYCNSQKMSILSENFCIYFTVYCLILNILRKPNPLIALLFIQNNSQFKNIAETCLPAWMLSSSSILYVQVCPALQIFSKQQMSPSELSSCCYNHVFSYYYAQFQLQFFLLKRVKCRPFLFSQLFSQPKQLNLVPRSSRLTVHLLFEGCIFDVISSLNTKFFQIWPSVTGYGELNGCFQPIRIGEIF